MFSHRWGAGAAALGLSAIVLFAAAGCGGDDDDGGDTPDVDRGQDVAIVIPAGSPIVIGTSSALTGPIRERGEEYRDAAITAISAWKEENGETIAGHEIHVMAADDGCTAPDQAAVAARSLSNEPGLVGVIGPQCSGGAQSAIPIFARDGIVAISGSATRTDLTVDQGPDGFFFRTAYRNDLEGLFQGIFIAGTIEAETVYVIDSGEPYSIDLANSAVDYLQAAGVDVVGGRIRVGDVDFSELAAGIAAANPDIVAFLGFNPEAGLLYRQIRDAGYDGLFGAGDAAASLSNFVEPVGAVGENVLFSGCQIPLPPEFEEKLLEVHGEIPSAAFTAQFADATTILLNAILVVAEEQPDGSLVIQPAELRDAVRATHFQDGLSGTLAFDASGDRVVEPGQMVSDLLAEAHGALDADIFADLGLIPCQIQDGVLVPLTGPTSGEIRLP